MLPVGISPKLLFTDCWFTPSTRPVIFDGAVPGAVTLPPVLPATVRPSRVPAGWSGSVTV